MLGPLCACAEHFDIIDFAEFEDSHEDSQIEVLLEPVGEGTRITIRHSNVPDGQLGYEQGGWQESYFDPMRQYFGRVKG